MNFDEKTVVVTGAAKGIGAAASQRFHELGANVVRLDVEPPASSDGAADVDRSLYVECDVSRADQVKTAFKQAVERFGAVDVLVNNAGIQSYGTVLETSEDDWDRIMSVNVKGAFLCAREALHTMGERGVIVNVSSVQGLMSESRVAAYATSKTALIGLTRSIAVDFAPGIRCVAVCPGTVDTPLLQWAVEQADDPEAMMDDVRAMHLTQRIAQPEEIAGLIAFLAGDEASFITGHTYRIDGGLGVKVGGMARR